MTVRLGAYFYPWYSPQRWREARHPFCPLIGEYESSSACAIDWQVQNIRKASLDFLVIEVISPSDWCAPICYSTIDRLLGKLTENGISYTFLIDNKVGPANTLVPSRTWRYDEYIEIMEMIKRRWGLSEIFGDGGRGILFAFSPEFGEAAFLKKNYPEYKWLFPIYLPHWANLLDDWHKEQLVLAGFGNFHAGSVFDALTSCGYIPFWSSDRRFQVANDVASVVPGYDDSGLVREPQIAPLLPRRDGLEYVEQFHTGQVADASIFLIYSWNEYFEGTTIEPTLQYGDFYIELTRRLAQQVKSGDRIHIPERMGNPEAVSPIYLTPELECAAQRHPDKVPRWDQDNYVATISFQTLAVIEQAHVVFPMVRVQNAGLKPWHIQTENEPICLGVRLRNSSGLIVREGRAELGDKDISEGEIIEVNLCIETNDLPTGCYRAEIDVVWEGRYWFNPESAFNLPVTI